MELYGIKQLYNSLSNGLGSLFLSHYLSFIGKKKRESVVGTMLDKQCACTKSRVYRNRFHEIRNYYLKNPMEQEFLLDKYPDAKNADDACDMLYVRLKEFYVNARSIITEPFFRHIADKVEKYKSEDVYTYYFNLLSTTPVKKFKE